MTIQLNHTIVPARDGRRSARWLAELLGLPEPTPFGHFWQVRAENGIDLDFDTYGDSDDVGERPFTTGHYAFLVGEDDFDAVHARIVERQIEHWADPGRTRAGEINHHDGGRGVYFADANADDHLFEIITRPYGG